MMVKTTILAALSAVLSLTTAYVCSDLFAFIILTRHSIQQQPMSRLANEVPGSLEAVADEPEKVEFLGYVNSTDLLNADCPQFPRNGQDVKVGEVWEENPNDWYAQPLKWWNHRHAFEPGFCIETRFGWDKDTGRWFKANHLRDSATYSEWYLSAWAAFGPDFGEGIVGWNADKARWQICRGDVPTCGGGSRFAMNKNECSRFRIKTGRVIIACKTYTNDNNRICGEKSRKHHGRKRCGTGRNSHYWFGTETGCWEN